MVPYVVSAVVAVTTVMHVLLFVYVMRECEGARVTAMRVWGPGMWGCGECVYGWGTWFRWFV